MANVVGGAQSLDVSEEECLGINKARFLTLVGYIQFLRTTENEVGSIRQTLEAVDRLCLRVNERSDVKTVEQDFEYFKFDEHSFQSLLHIVFTRTK